jgi:hypothetical protein
MNPFLIWNELAWKTVEMAIASAQVIDLTIHAIRDRQTSITG